MNGGLEKERIFELITNIKIQKQKSFIKYLGVSAFLYLVTAYSGRISFISINNEYFNLEIPVLYVVFFSSLALTSSLIEIINYFIYNELQRVAINTLFRFDSVDARSIIYDPGSAIGLFVSPQFRFIKTRPSSIAFLSVVVFAGFIPIVSVYIFLYYINIRYMIKFLLGNEYVFYGNAATVLVFMLMMYPILFLIYIFRKVEYIKNNKFIRWNFLYPMHRRYNQYPYNIDKWINE